MTDANFFPQTRTQPCWALPARRRVLEDTIFKWNKAGSDNRCKLVMIHKEFGVQGHGHIQCKDVGGIYTEGRKEYNIAIPNEKISSVRS